MTAKSKKSVTNINNIFWFLAYTYTQQETRTNLLYIMNIYIIESSATIVTVVFIKRHIKIVYPYPESIVMLSKSKNPS